MSPMRMRPCLLVWLCWVLVTACAASQTPSDTSMAAAADPAVLRVGVSANAPPLVTKQGDAVVGLEPELARGLAGRMGKTVRFVELPWEDQIPALLEDRIDIIMSGMSITPMRQVRIAFSDPYFRTGQMALVRKIHRDKFPQGFYAVQGLSLVMRFGVVKGTTGESFVRKAFGNAKEIRGYRTSGSAVDDLVTGRIDILIHDGPIVLMLAAENESRGIVPLPDLMTEEYLAWGIRKDDTALLEAANGYVADLKSTGQLTAIVRRWIPY